MQLPVISTSSKERSLRDAVMPVALGLSLLHFSSQAQSFRTEASRGTNALGRPKPALANRPTAAPQQAQPYRAPDSRYLTAPKGTNEPSAQKILPPAPKRPAQLSKLNRAINWIHEKADNILGNQTVDLIVFGGACIFSVIGAAAMWIRATRKLYPEALSGYVLEPVPRNDGDTHEYLSTRTATLPEVSLQTVFGCSPHLRRAVRRAQDFARKHPELPILFFPSKTGPEIFTLLRTAISNSVASSPHVQAAVRNANVRFNELCERLSGVAVKQENTKLTPMDKAFLVFTFERYDAVSTRLIVFPVKDVISLLAEPERWYDAAHCIPVEQDRDAALRRLVRQMEIATTLVIDRPEIFKHFLKGQPKVLDEVQRSSGALRRMLLLRPKESLEFVEEWLSQRARSKKTQDATTAVVPVEGTFTSAEEAKLSKLLRYSTADCAKPGELLPHCSKSSSTGAQPPYTYKCRSNWHAVLDIPKP